MRVVCESNDEETSASLIGWLELALTTLPSKEIKAARSLKVLQTEYNNLQPAEFSDLYVLSKHKII